MEEPFGIENREPSFALWASEDTARNKNKNVEWQCGPIGARYR